MLDYMWGNSLCRNRLLCEQLAIMTKRICLHPIEYLNPGELTDKIFLIKNTDDDGQTFETIVSNK